MSANTTPDGITYPTGTDAIAPLHTVFAVMATSIQNALNTKQLYRAASVTALNAMSGMSVGSVAVVASTPGVDVDMRWIYSTSGHWIPLGPLYATNVGSLNGLATTLGGTVNVKLADNLVGGALAITADGNVYRYTGSTGTPWMSISGLVPVFPTSTAGFASSNGSIFTFTGATAFIMNGIFSGVFAKYLIKIQIAGGTGVTQPGFRLRGAGVDVSAATYYQELVYGSGSATTAVSQLGQNQMQVPASGDYHKITLEMDNPFIALPTMHTYNGTSWNSSGGAGSVYMSGGAQSSSTSYDGFTVFANTNAFSGTVQVFGYAG
jgi:hypothetical protein